MSIYVYIFYRAQKITLCMRIPFVWTITLQLGRFSDSMRRA